MPSTQYLTSQLYMVVLSDVSHPIEGIFYLLLLAIIVRIIWPITWNNFLKKISAPVNKSLNQDSQSRNESESLPGSKSKSNESNARYKKEKLS